jgi:hypothetical protein
MFLIYKKNEKCFMKYLKFFEEFKWFGKSEEIELDKELLATLLPIKMGSNNEEVKTLQIALEALGFKLSRFGVDSKFGSETLGQTKSLLDLVETNPSLKKMAGDINLDMSNNEVSPEAQLLIKALSENEEASKAIETHYEELYKKIGSGELIFKDIIAKKISNPEAFVAKLHEVCKDLGIAPNWLLYVMWMESKIDPKIVNSISGATGLIQFMPSTAKGLGTSVEALRQMDAVEQMNYVHKYFLPHKGKMKSAEDVYFAVFFPAAVGKDEDWVMKTKHVSASKIAAQNKVVNLNGDDQITVGEFKDYVKKGIAQAGVNGSINKGMA